MAFALVLVSSDVVMVGADESVLIHKVPSQVVFGLLACEVVDPESVLPLGVTVELQAVALANEFQIGSIVSNINGIVARETAVVPRIFGLMSGTVDPESVVS